MGDIHIFKMEGPKAKELKGSSVELEKSLQMFMETNLEPLLGIKFLATEYSTGKLHGGRVDSLGLDENGLPVIIEYKRSLNQAVINQGLYYLDWLQDHRAEFELLVLKQLGKEYSNNIDWSNPRLLCIAGDFSKYDISAVNQIPRNISLIRYRQFENQLLLLELINSTLGQNRDLKSVEPVTGEMKKTRTSPEYSTVSMDLAKSGAELHDRFGLLKAFIEALGDDVQMNVLKYYIAFKRIKNFACIQIYPKTNNIVVYVKVNPDTIKIEEGFTRDVRKIGHLATGDLEITIRSDADLKRAKDLIVKSYETN
jgi:predicted transport protein